MTLPDASRVLLQSLAMATSTDGSAPTVFEWWSELILPTVVGAGSLAIALVATFVAARSNRLARAATAAAARSNAIAKRANELEQQRDQRALEAEARADRQAFCDRWSPVLAELGDQMVKNPAVTQLSPAWIENARLTMELDIRGYGTFPVDAAMQMLLRASKPRNPFLMMQALACAHALIHEWVRNPVATDEAVQRYNTLVDSAIRRHADASTSQPGM